MPLAVREKRFLEVTLDCIGGALRRPVCLGRVPGAVVQNGHSELVHVVRPVAFDFLAVVHIEKYSQDMLRSIVEGFGNLPVQLGGLCLQPILELVRKCRAVVACGKPVLQRDQTLRRQHQVGPRLELKYITFRATALRADAEFDGHLDFAATERKVQAPRRLCVGVTSEAIDAKTDDDFDLWFALIVAGDIAVVRDDNHYGVLGPPGRNQLKSGRRFNGENVSLTPFSRVPWGARHSTPRHASSEIAGVP